MRTKVPAVLPLFRSEMQLRLLGALLLQPERAWTLAELAATLDAPASSVHRELGRAERAGIIHRDAAARPHRFQAATADPLYEPLAELLRRTVGVEQQLHEALARPDVVAAVIYGSWASGARRADSDIDVLVIGEADLRGLRRLVRPIGKTAGRTIDLTVLSVPEYLRMRRENASFTRRLHEQAITPLAGELDSITAP